MTVPPTLGAAPPSVTIAGEWQLGAYRTPFEYATFGGGGLRHFRLKEWHYLSFTTDDWYVAVGLVQMGYVASLFAYTVDRSRGARSTEYRSISPLGRAARMAPSSVRGTSTWGTRDATLSIAAKDGWDVSIDVPLGDARLHGRAHIETRDSLAVLHRLGHDRVAYTHKAAGCSASGHLQLGARSIALDGGLASSDWTRSEANRLTRWKWASLSGETSTGATVGLNLSAEVYDDARGHSVENALFVDGAVERLGGVRFTVPSDPKSGRWTIHSIEGDEVELSFEPLGAHEEHLNFGVVRTDFVQPYGRFDGRVRGHDVSGCFGVVETHRSRW